MTMTIQSTRGARVRRGSRSRPVAPRREFSLSAAEAEAIRDAVPLIVAIDPLYDEAPNDAHFVEFARAFTSAGYHLNPVAERVHALGALIRQELAGFASTAAGTEASQEIASYLIDEFCAGLQTSRDWENLDEAVDQPRAVISHNMKDTRSDSAPPMLAWRLRYELQLPADAAPVTCAEALLAHHGNCIEFRSIDSMCPSYARRRPDGVVVISIPEGVADDRRAEAIADLVYQAFYADGSRSETDGPSVGSDEQARAGAMFAEAFLMSGRAGSCTA